jgi:hypothetical protein
VSVEEILRMAKVTLDTFVALDYFYICSGNVCGDVGRNEVCTLH